MARGYIELIRRNRDFRSLWLGELISFIGDWFNLVALYAAVQSLTDSGLAVALVLVAKTVPVFIMTPFAGPVIDRFDRRHILLATNLARGLAALGLVLAHWAESLVGLYGTTVLMMIAAGVAFPAKSAIIPMLVDKADVPTANALGGGTWSAMLALGAALGGITTAQLGIPAAFVLDACTFALSGYFFFRLPALIPKAASAGTDVSFRAGVEHLRLHRYTLATALLKPMMQIGGGILGMIALYGTRVFPEASSPAFVGLIYATRGVGALIGSLALRRLVGDEPRILRRVIVFAFLFSAAAYALVGFAPMYWVCALGFFLAAVGSATVWVFSGTLLQVEADRAFHGRIFSVEFGINNLALTISSLVAGGLVDAGLEVQEVTRYFAVLAALPALLWFLAHRRWAPRA